MQGTFGFPFLVTLLPSMLGTFQEGVHLRMQCSVMNGRLGLEHFQGQTFRRLLPHRLPGGRGGDPDRLGAAHAFLNRREPAC